MHETEVAHRVGRVAAGNSAVLCGEMTRGPLKGYPPKACLRSCGWGFGRLPGLASLLRGAVSVTQAASAVLTARHLPLSQHSEESMFAPGPVVCHFFA